MKKIIKNWLFLINILASQTVVQASDDIKQFESYDQIISKHSFVNGKGVCRAFGIKLYEAKLLSEYPIKKKNPFGQNLLLELQYFKSFKGQRIAKRSLKEIKQLGISNPNQHKIWLDWMLANFPDVEKGDLLSGLYLLNEGIIMFVNKEEIALNTDAAFAKSFFSIWLDQHTTEPELRKDLLENAI